MPSEHGAESLRYVRNDPLGAIDPSGFDGEDVNDLPGFGAHATVPFGAEQIEQPPVFDLEPLPTFDATDIPAWSSPTGELTGIQRASNRDSMGSRGELYYIPDETSSPPLTMMGPFGPIQL